MRTCHCNGDGWRTRRTKFSHECIVLPFTAVPHSNNAPAVSVRNGHACSNEIGPRAFEKGVVHMAGDAIAE